MDLPAGGTVGQIYDATTNSWVDKLPERDPRVIALAGEIKLVRLALKQAVDILDDAQDWEQGGSAALIVLKSALEATK